MKLKLLPLTIGGFGIGMTEFVIMGVLPDVARDLHISIPTAGHLISAYALGVVCGAPLLTALAGKMAPQKTLAALMVLFAVGNALSSFAPGYVLMLLTRFISGLPHGAFFGVGAVVAGRLADPGKEAQAIATMFAGLTIANIFGVPAGTFIGHNFSWRITFVIVAVVGLVAVWSIKRWLPRLPAAKEANLARELKVFSRLELWLILGIIMIGTGGFFAWFSYIAPLLINVTGFGSNDVTWNLIIAGFGMLVGNTMGGRMADRFSPIKATCWLLLSMVVALIAVSFAAEYKVTSVIMTFTTGAIAFAMIAPIQMLMINAAKGAEMLGSAVSQGAFNVSNALGAYLGGLPLAAGYGYTSPQWVGAALALGGFFIAATVLISSNKTPELKPATV
ncbi:MAG: MFS transporter [Cytophagales bacterium CG18_big_fil_WC_8_21_14_2_50_42_9]|nr:MAG: MFS transporter [Cytophagales bacterium CG18_big_fil_WC_8_21_14_2_50_42_9]